VSLEVILALSGALAVLLLAAVAIARRRRRTRQQGKASSTGSQAVDLTATDAVVLAHGLLGFDAIGVGRARQQYFRGIRDALEHAGVPTFAPKVAPLGSIPERAEQLAAFVKALPYQSITVIGHSMGGLDARYAIAKLGIEKQVRTLVTIGTPHRGSPLADLANRGPARQLRNIAARFGLRTDAIDWLTTENLEAFNRDVLDDPSVAYYCVVGQTALKRLWRNPFLLGSSLFLRRSGPNDGLVTAKSQQWGEMLEEIDTDHLGQIGWSLRSRAAALYIRLIRRVTAAPVAKASDADAREETTLAG